MTTTTYRLPPGPKTPRLFNGIAFLAARNAMIRRLQRRYGDAFTLDMPGFGRMVLVARPDLVKQVYTAKPDVLHGGKNPLGEILGPGSLFSMDEERHLRERRMLLPPFHGDRMRSYEQIGERFDPDRYLGRKPDTYAWIPFGGGVRRCLGAAFAQFEIDVVLRTMLRNFELQPTSAPPERESFRGVAFAPGKGGVAVVRRRPRSAEGQASGPESTSVITALNSAETRSSSSPRTSARTSV